PKLEQMRALVSRKAAATPVPQRLLIQSRVLFNYKKLDRLAGFTIRNTYCSTFQHPGVFGNDFFNLVRIDIEARYKNHVFFPVNQAHTPFGAYDGDITCLEVALIGKSIPCLVGPLPVAQHDLRPPNGKLAGFAW